MTGEMRDFMAEKPLPRSEKRQRSAMLSFRVTVFELEVIEKQGPRARHVDQRICARPRFSTVGEHHHHMSASVPKHNSGPPMSAPIFNRLNALTGDVAESPIAKILDTADHIAAELDSVRELQTRNQELGSELTLARADADGAAETIGLLLAESDEKDGRIGRLVALVDEAGRRCADLKAERDELAGRLHTLDEAHAITLQRLARANNDLARTRQERDTLRASVSAVAR